jgi:hypothetical protein
MKTDSIAAAQLLKNSLQLSDFAGREGVRLYCRPGGYFSLFGIFFLLLLKQRIRI